MNIKLITVSEIYTLSNDKIIKYILEIYNKINNLIITIGKPIENIKMLEYEICNYKSHKYVKLNSYIINDNNEKEINNIEKEEKEDIIKAQSFSYEFI